jgi:hypothetical protein
MTYTKPEPGMPCVLEIGGKQLELRFTLKVLKVLEAEHQITVLKGEGLGDALRDPAKLGVILYFGIKTKHPDITEDWVEENVDASMLLDIAPMLAYATTGRWPDMERILANLPNAERPPEPTTGSPSGPLADTTSTVLN